MRPILRALACAAALTLLACGSGTSSSPDGSSPSMCSADVPAGQACNTLANIGDLVTPTCVTGTMPVAAGGTILDGIYVFTSQTYYNAQTCSTPPISETIAISGGCVQVAFKSAVTGTASTRFVVQGNTLTMTSTCANYNVDAGSTTMDVRTSTFTATPTTFTLFSSNPDRVEVFTKQ